ncbi:Hypothetical Protein FCC1311_033902 [Hondaea fermentalgiana]|uniref:Uncharacterized protein n=1 Tax=Hondaea fermentalgiana TaxID=2315210 RepID=A0A2R5G801_9STRA|nr:Hypothetical Protein FCC1311_033902 [Hondaea fermentalgiana]|eukprot:GBG27167.1 Hypothetical Protein FCC1311_033902 [Hondaea fermentalgiana]
MDAMGVLRLSKRIRGANNRVSKPSPRHLSPRQQSDVRTYADYEWTNRCSLDLNDTNKSCAKRSTSSIGITFSYGRTDTSGHESRPKFYAYDADDKNTDHEPYYSPSS